MKTLSRSDDLILGWLNRSPEIRIYLFSVEESLINKCIKFDAADLNLAALIVSILQCNMADRCGGLIATVGSKKNTSPS